MHINYTKFNAFKYKKPTISVPNELSVPNVRKKKYIREEPFSLLNIS